MSLYELTLILKESTEAAKAKALVPGEIKAVKSWGNRDLAYPIGGVLKGAYFHFQTELSPDQVGPLETSLRQNDQILRYLLIKAKE